MKRIEFQPTSCGLESFLYQPYYEGSVMPASTGRENAQAPGKRSSLQLGGDVHSATFFRVEIRGTARNTKSSPRQLTPRGVNYRGDDFALCSTRLPVRKPGRRGGCPPRLPQIRTGPIKASGSSGHGFAQESNAPAVFAGEPKMLADIP